MVKFIPSHIAFSKMKLTDKIWFILFTPGRIINMLIHMDSKQMRSVFMVAMLLGMIANQVIAFVYLHLAYKAVKSGETYAPFFELMVEQLRFLAGLTGLFAAGLVAIVINADRLRVKIGGNEIGIGKQDGDRQHRGHYYAEDYVGRSFDDLPEPTGGE